MCASRRKALLCPGVRSLVMADASRQVDPLESPVPLETEVVGTGRSVGDFLAWAYSDVMDSMSRGALAEFLVMQALKVDLRVRNPGDPIDIRYERDGYRASVEVKASSAVQRWPGDVHRISFGIRKSLWWDHDGKVHGPLRWGDCWVFCVFRPEARDLLVARSKLFDVKSWRFWAVPRDWLPDSSSISLAHLIRLFGASVGYADLSDQIDEAVSDRAGDPCPTPLARLSADGRTEADRLHFVGADRVGNPGIPRARARIARGLRSGAALLTRSERV